MEDLQLKNWKFELCNSRLALEGSFYMLDCLIRALEEGSAPENYLSEAPQEAFQLLFVLICRKTSEITSYSDKIINYYSEKFQDCRKRA